MKSVKTYFFITLITCLLACEKEKPEQPDFSSKITITAGEVSQIEYRSATISGTLGDTYGQEVSDYGHCWDTLSAPTLAGNFSSFGLIADSVNFSSLLENLKPGKKYYVRGYFTFGDISVYSTEKSFYTRSTGLPVVETKDVSAITTISASCGGNITDNGGAAITARGVCWNTTGTPTVFDTHTEDGSEISSFTSELVGLAIETKYYIRAYATNENGTVYGSVTIFSTKGTVTDYDGNTYNTVKIGDQVWMAENLKTTHYADGTDIPHVEDGSAWDNLTAIDKAYCYYDSSISNGDVYGALYTWAAAMKGAVSSNINPSGVQGVCPSGWHMPSDDEWEELAEYISNDRGTYTKLGVDWNNVGIHLKATSGWNDGGNGTDDYDFSGLPGGLCNRFDNFFKSGINGYWWSATLYDGWHANGRSLCSEDDDLTRDKHPFATGSSIPCIRDE